MKKLFLICLLFFQAYALQAKEQTTIIDYTPVRQDAVMSIALQDALDFFVGSNTISNLSDTAHNFVSFFLGSYTVSIFGMSKQQFMEENKKVMITILNDPNKMKKVIINNKGTVIGFAVFFKTREQSIEDIISSTPSLTKEQIQSLKTFMPHLKETKAECENFVELECLAVHQEHRRKGYAKALMQEFYKASKALWPDIKRIKLNVNAHNKSARTFYEAEGFIESSIQSPMVGFLKAKEYEKELS